MSVLPEIQPSSTLSIKSNLESVTSKKANRDLQVAQANIANLEKQNTLLRVRLEESDGHKRYTEMVTRVKDAEARAAEMQRHMKHMEKITLG